MLNIRIIISSVVAALLAAGTASATETSARHAFLIDLGTDTVLMAKDADARIPPASMSKLMTVEVVLRALAEGRLSPDTEFQVSEKAWKTGGSKMFVRVGDSIRVEDLLRGIIISSGNDACVVVAEGFDGSEEAFAERLNRRAGEIGLEDSHFANASGWPHPEHYMTAHDIARLAAHIFRSYPKYYPLFAEAEFTWEGVRQRNRNPLIGAIDGADGLKTGYTEASGYGLVASAMRDGRRIVAVLGGLANERDRAAESKRLVEWAFREFRHGTFFEKGARVGSAKVWLGAGSHVDLVAGAEIRGLLRISSGEPKAEIHLQEPVPAPIANGQRLGTILVTTPDGAIYEAPALAAEEVPAGGFGTRLVMLIRKFARRGQAE